MERKSIREIIGDYFRPRRIAKDAFTKQIKKEKDLKRRTVPEIIEFYFSPLRVAISAVLDDIKEE